MISKKEQEVMQCTWCQQILDRNMYYQNKQQLKADCIDCCKSYKKGRQHGFKICECLKCARKVNQPSLRQQRHYPVYLFNYPQQYEAKFMIEQLIDDESLATNYSSHLLQIRNDITPENEYEDPYQNVEQKQIKFDQIQQEQLQYGDELPENIESPYMIQSDLSNADQELLNQYVSPQMFNNQIDFSQNFYKN